MANQKKKLTFDGIRKLASQKGITIHFVGIGGVSMYSLARLALLLGATVTGSDRIVSPRTKELALRGVKIFIGHEGSNVRGAGLVVYSHAISERNSELINANNLGIPTVSRAELLGALMLDYKGRIGISGTHGKSTTVSMLDAIFSAGMSQPTTLSGAELINGEPLRVGRGEMLIYEACEYRDSFLCFSPTVAIALNLELDHTDYFHDIKAMRSSYVKALSKASTFVLLNLDDEHLSEIMHDIHARVITFGQGERADWRYHITAFLDDGMEFTLYHHGAKVVKIKLSVPGVHNVTDAAAAAAAALEMGAGVQIVKEAIESFRGVPRRLELVGNHHGRPVYYDYAHHPTEIIAGINALKPIARDFITVVFKPHTFSRTMALWSEFSAALSLADHIVLTDIYPAREKPITGVNSRRLAADIGERAYYAADHEVCSVIDEHTQGAIIVMGAGDTEMIKNDLISK
ncbi:MAG: UDP-N-acetylmuramate--L-alanine ligase [Clostridia bacterium]|nr:UDP-N-acetylmuramate--L-alanine ligase [Clostridia bacterium]